MRISSQLAVRLGLVALLAGAIATIAHQQSSIGGLRGGHQELMEASQEAQRLAQENREIPRLLVENQEVKKLREANQDLLKLRNEVRQLRRQTEGLGSLQAENQRLLAANSAADKPATAAPPQPADFLPRSALHDAGLATPEAAVQTAFWAMSQGNLERLSQCVAIPDDAPWKLAWMQGLIQHMANFNGFRIDEKKTNSAGEVELDLQSAVGGSIVPVIFRLVGNEWKLLAM